jgi:hypothetical protein
LQCTSVDADTRDATLSAAIRFYGDEADIAQLRRQHVSSTAKVFIERASIGSHGFDSSDYYVRVADKFTELPRIDGDSEGADPFRRVGLTLSESCILSRLWTRASAVDWLSQRRIRIIKVLWSIFCKGMERRKTEARLHFLFFLFSDFLSTCCSNALLSEALNLLKSI